MPASVGRKRWPSRRDQGGLAPIPGLIEAEARKRRAAERAVEFVESGMRLGLGTGSTARHVLDVLGERLRSGVLRDIAGVPTSRDTEAYARTVGVPLISLEARQRLDVALDGADEVDPALNLIKGLGGALLWEKIVACVADRFVIVTDESKRVNRLGERAPLPVEVVSFGWRTHLRFFEELGSMPVLRTGEDGRPFITDGGHYIIDCRFNNGIPNPAELEPRLCTRAGIVETGLFLGLATDVVMAGDSGIEVRARRA